MIPKIIHYCWFGKGEKNAEVRRCISTWKEKLPDYEIKEWNEKNFNYKRYSYTREAYYLGKYAFVSDVCRLYALYREGGIYLDTDIEVLKSFDPYLTHKSFVGYEVDDLVGTGVIGAEKEEEWIKMMYDSYMNPCGFISWDGSLYNTPNTIRLTNMLKNILKEKQPVVYPVDYFCAKKWDTKELLVTNNTVCIHHYQSSWFNNPVRTNMYEQWLCDRFHLTNRHFFTKIYKKYIALISII